MSILIIDPSTRERIALAGHVQLFPHRPPRPLSRPRRRRTHLAQAVGGAVLLACGGTVVLRPTPLLIALLLVVAVAFGYAMALESVQNALAGAAGWRSRALAAEAHLATLATVGGQAGRR